MQANRKRNRTKAFGVGLVEVALGLGVMTLGMAGLNQVGSDASSQARSIAAATRMEQVHQAAIDYVRANQAALTTQTASGGTVTVYAGRATATGADPGSTVAGLPSLQGGGFLPSAYVDTNNFGQRHAVLIRQPATGRLEFLVTQFGGRQIRDADLGRIAQKIGAAGGAILQRPVGGVAAGTIVGTGGGWRTTAATWNGAVVPTAGRAMSYSGLSSTGTGLEDFLYRNQIPGVPEANTMRTAINMAGNDITAGRNVEVSGSISNPDPAQGVVVSDTLAVHHGANLCTAGGYCAVTFGSSAPGETYGGIASANNGWMTFTAAGQGVAGTNGGLAIIGSDPGGGLGGNLVVGGRTEHRGRVEVHNDWVRFYGDNGVFWERFGSGLHMADSSWIRTYGGAGIYSGTGQIRSDSSMSSPIYYDTSDPNYFADPNGHSRMNVINANHVHSYGELVAAGTIQSQSGTIVAHNGSVVAAHNVQANGLMFANRYYDIFNTGYSMQPSGYSRLQQVHADSVNAEGNIRANANGYIKTSHTSFDGWGCESGAIAINGADGGMLFCQSGVYRAISGGVVGRLYGGGGNGDSFSCEGGYSPRWFHFNVGNTNNALFAQCVKHGY